MADPHVLTGLISKRPEIAVLLQGGMEGCLVFRPGSRNQMSWWLRPYA